jgi:toxin YoeB
LRVVWTKRAKEDIEHWRRLDSAKVEKIKALIADIRANGPLNGIGKPEHLKHLPSAPYSRRITGEHRLVYRVTGKQDAQQLEILQCRYHY